MLPAHAAGRVCSRGAAGGTAEPRLPGPGSPPSGPGSLGRHGLPKAGGPLPQPHVRASPYWAVTEAHAVPGRDTDATSEWRCGKFLEERARWGNSIVAVCEELALVGVGGWGSPSCLPQSYLLPLFCPLQEASFGSGGRFNGGDRTARRGLRAGGHQGCVHTRVGVHPTPSALAICPWPLALSCHESHEAAHEGVWGWEQQTSTAGSFAQRLFKTGVRRAF